MIEHRTGNLLLQIHRVLSKGYGEFIVLHLIGKRHL